MEFSQYVGKPMLAWLWYNRNYEERFGNTNIVCYIYPRVFDNRSFATIDAEEDFPENGRLEVFIQGGKNAEEVFSLFGPLVSVKLNREIAPNYKGHNRYRVSYYAPSDNAAAGYAYGSDISIERISGNRFFQLITTDTDFESIQKTRFLTLANRPFTNGILLKTGGMLYGPFLWEAEAGGVRLSSSRRYQYQIGAFPWEEYVGKSIPIGDQDGKMALRLIPFSALPDFGEWDRMYDWISDEQLLTDLTDALKAGNQYTRTELRQLKEAVELFLDGGAQDALTEERIKRMKELSENLSAWNEFTDNLVRKTLEESGETLANAAAEHYMQAAKDRIAEYEQARERVEEIQRQEEERQRKVDELQAAEHTLEEQIRALREEAENPSVVSVAKEEMERLNREITRLQGETERLRGEMDQLRGENQTLSEQVQSMQPVRDVEAAVQARSSELADYERKIQAVRAQYDYEREQKRKLDDSLKALLRQYRDEANQVTRLFDMRLLNRILHEGEDDEAQTAAAVAGPLFHPAVLHVPMTREEIIDRAAAAVRAGTGLDRNSSVNALLCLTQGFVTTVTGMPGVGKTTFCRLLGQALGLTAEDGGGRFVEIPVERGWTSRKEFAGAYPLPSGAAESGSAKVWEFFKQLAQECGDPAASAPFVMLLDEADASPVESYWSAFLRLCDMDPARRFLSLGDGRSCPVPAHLRFLATAGLDRADGFLSPRFLDRSWVITLYPGRTGGGAADGKAVPDGGAVPYASLRDAFLLPSAAANGLDEQLLRKWNRIRIIFENHRLPFTARSRKMIREYIAAACLCMERDRTETRFAPLDFALSQKLLPAVHGQGERYRELFYDLSKECPETLMPLSARHLERMRQAAAENGGVYRFFGE